MLKNKESHVRSVEKRLKKEKIKRRALVKELEKLDARILSIDSGSHIGTVRPRIDRIKSCLEKLQNLNTEDAKTSIFMEETSPE